MTKEWRKKVSKLVEYIAAVKEEEERDKLVASTIATILFNLTRGPLEAVGMLEAVKAIMMAEIAGEMEVKKGEEGR